MKVEQFRVCTQQAHDGTSLPVSLAPDIPATRTAISPIPIGGRLRVDVLEYAAHHEHFPHNRHRINF